MKPNWLFKAAERNAFLEKAGFRSDTRLFLDEAADAAGPEDGKQARFLDQAKGYWSGEIREDALPEDLGLRSLIVVFGFFELSSIHRAKAIPEAVTAATCRDLQRWMDDILGGETSFQTLPIGWFRNHIKRGLLEVGRLQFVPGRFSELFCVFANQKSLKEVVLARPGLRCSEKGLPAPDGFETTWEEDGERVTANPVDPATGGVRAELITLDLQDWRSCLRKGAATLDVHIPSGPRLSEEACRQAFSEARELYDRCFPEIQWEAFSCTSWLLDRELHSCLPESSGIVQFGRLFHPLPVMEPNSNQFMERVFRNALDWRNFEPQTSLQRLAKEHLLRGGEFRTTGGIRLRKRG